jgi:hypothetical protein
MKACTKARALLAALFLLVLASSTFAAQGVLPPSFGGWTISGNETQMAPKDLEQVVADKAPALREYGVTATEQAGYSQGSQAATITLYRMTDPSAAFGAFTLLRDPTMAPLTLGPSVAYGASAKDHDLFVVGNFLLDVKANSALPADKDLKALADGLRPRSDHAPYPLIARFMPKSGFVPNSDRYVLGRLGLGQVFPVGNVNQRDWLGFENSAEAIIAHYHLNGEPKDKDALLLLALYPTQQVAAKEYNGFNKWIALTTAAAPADNVNGNGGAPSGGVANGPANGGGTIAASAPAAAQNGASSGLPVVYGKRSGPLVALLSGVDSSQAANAILGQIQYSSQVTWDEPTHELTDPNIGTIVVGAIMGTGSIMLFALVAGVGFGGLRLFTKVILPGRVFDRQDDVEILQLGITSKPIHSIDSSRGD